MITTNITLYRANTLTIFTGHCGARKTQDSEIDMKLKELKIITLVGVLVSTTSPVTACGLFYLHPGYEGGSKPHEYPKGHSTVVEEIVPEDAQIAEKKCGQ